MNPTQPSNPSTSQPVAVANRYIKLCDDYLALSDAYAQLDASHLQLSYKFKHLRQRFQNLEDEAAANQELQAEVSRIRSQYTDSLKVIEHLQSEVRIKQTLLVQFTHDMELSSQQVEYTQELQTYYEVELARIQSEISFHQTRIAEIEAHNQRLEHRIQSLESDVNRMREQLEHAESRATTAESALAAKETELQTLQARLETQEIQTLQLQQHLQALQVLEELRTLLSDTALERLTETEAVVALNQQIFEEPPDPELLDSMQLINSYMGIVSSGGSPHEPAPKNNGIELADDLFEEQWDKQIEQDAIAGKLDFLIQEAVGEFKAGRLKAG